MSSNPERTCVGCRQKSAPIGLLRFTVDAQQELRLDYRGSAPGRGAWLCPKPRCMNRAMKRNAFSRSFRRPVSAPGGDVMHERVAAVLALNVDATLKSAKRAGALTPIGAGARTFTWEKPSGIMDRTVENGRWADSIEMAIATYHTWMEDPSRGL